MKTVFSDRLERGRIMSGHYSSRAGDPHGAFQITGPNGTSLIIMSSGTGDEAEGWEHVSVSTRHRTPNWSEMCFVKDLFWREDECVVQYHPPKANHVNCHPHCLHLWRPLNAKIPMPPAEFVGPKSEQA
jgi:hypothetical protein